MNRHPSRFFVLYAAILLAASAPAGLWAGDYDRLLEGYLAHDSEGRRLELAREQAALALQRFSLEKGVSFTVSTGTAVFGFSPAGTAISGTPSVTIGMPRMRNTRLNVAAPLANESGNLNRYGVEMSVTTGLINGDSDALSAELMEWERAFLSAERNIQYRYLEAEREFCERIKALIAGRDAMLQAQGEVIKARYDLEAKRAGGYGASSVILRTAELKLRSREREQREAERTLDTALRNFAGDCGVEEAGIPGDIPDEALLAISGFDPARYKELENAVKLHEIHSLSRKSRDRRFSLDGSAGYAWNHLETAAYPSGVASGAADGSSVTAGADLSVGGVTVSTGISVPLNKPNEPSLTVSLQWQPSGSRVFGIERRLRQIEAETEQEAIVTAEKKFKDLTADWDRRMADLEWQRTSYEEEAELYRLNMEEQQDWLDRGLIRETDWMDARSTYLLAENKTLSARIDRRLYNLELQALFVPQNERAEER
jgi:hypothetical protein